MALLLSKSGVAARPLVWLWAAGAVLAAATLTLWSWYGTTVFFELVRAGWAACF